MIPTHCWRANKAIYMTPCRRKFEALLHSAALSSAKTSLLLSRCDQDKTQQHGAKRTPEIRSAKMFRAQSLRTSDPRLS
eukprot:15989-Heterococcus_DN1.PRE.1